MCLYIISHFKLYKIVYKVKKIQYDVSKDVHNLISSIFGPFSDKTDMISFEVLKIGPDQFIT